MKTTRITDHTFQNSRSSKSHFALGFAQSQRGISFPIYRSLKKSSGFACIIKRNVGRKRGRSERPASQAAPPGEAPDHEYWREWEGGVSGQQNVLFLFLA
jgi:hypothetical protein